MTLLLHGVASELRGFNRALHSDVLRLRDPISTDFDGADAALIRTRHDIERASASGFTKAVMVGEFSNEERARTGAFTDLMNLPGRFDYLEEGDILGVQAPTRHFRTLYRRSSRHNSFLVTERCNHYCLMCSQPPRAIEDGWIIDEIMRALPLVHPSTKSFAFTGGEPLTEWKRFIELLGRCRDILPNTAIHVLTNGRAFAQSEVVANWTALGHSQLMAGIPIYSAVDYIHDYVVQAKGAFDETVLGILKLKDRGQCVEVRVVLHAITAPRLLETCRWLSRNLPFVDHVALMGMENTGFALANGEMLWIDPIDYRDVLGESVKLLELAGMNVSVYNLPRCVLAPSVWPNAVQSISDWKNGYVEECSMCVEKPNCSGFFTSGRTRYSRAVEPILGLAQ